MEVVFFDEQNRDDVFTAFVVVKEHMVNSSKGLHGGVSGQILSKATRRLLLGDEEVDRAREPGFTSPDMVIRESSVKCLTSASLGSTLFVQADVLRRGRSMAFTRGCILEAKSKRTVSSGSHTVQFFRRPFAPIRSIPDSPQTNLSVMPIEVPRRSLPLTGHSKYLCGFLEFLEPGSRGVFDVRLKIPSQWCHRNSSYMRHSLLTSLTDYLTNAAHLQFNANHAVSINIAAVLVAPKPPRFGDVLRIKTRLVSCRSDDSLAYSEARFTREATASSPPDSSHKSSVDGELIAIGYHTQFILSRGGSAASDSKL